MSHPGGPGDLELLEALFRIRGYHIAAQELYERGRPADALLLAMRPVTDVLPWLENRLRAHAQALKDITNVLGTVGAAMRAANSFSRARRAFARSEDIVKETEQLLLEGADDPDLLRASALAALLARAADRYAEGIQSEVLSAYQESYGLLRIAAEVARDLELSGASSEALRRLGSAVAAPEPPPLLLHPDEFRRAADVVRLELKTRLGALDRTPEAYGPLAEAERLLADIAAAYDDGVIALAARLAASLYLQAYLRAQPWLRSAAPAVEEELSPLLARHLRVAINGRAPAAEVQALIDRARELIADARAVAV